MRSIFSVFALAAIATLAACDKAATEANGPLTGTWHYRAVGLTGTGPGPDDRVCDVEYTIDLTQNDNDVDGITHLEGGSTICYGDGVDTLEVPIHNQQLVGGEVQDGRVRLVFSQWANFAEIHPDRMEGVVEGYWQKENSGPIFVDTLGTFVMERVN
ncbi:MAG TPA: hypothetical protein VFQ39_09150 [Longimicrobium sp.]|nr:hypothetical protein [Longimicrobium sp.]